MHHLRHVGGSRDQQYAYNSECKWLLKAPAGKIIELELTALATEINTDRIYLFNGSRTNGDIMAILSGKTLPPVIRAPEQRGAGLVCD